MNEPHSGSLSAVLIIVFMEKFITFRIMRAALARSNGKLAFSYHVLATDIQRISIHNRMLSSELNSLFEY